MAHTECEELSSAVTQDDAVNDAQLVADAHALTVCVALGLPQADRDADTEGDLDADAQRDGLEVMREVTDAERLTEGEGV